MLKDVLRDLRGVVVHLRGEAEGRRRVTQFDAVGDTLSYCAAVLDAKINEIEDGLAWLSPDQYAEDVGTSPQTVRTWCRKGELDATPTPNGWRIRRGAQRQRKARAA
jgi:hypothetical protein